jgi:glutaredoxin
MQIIVYTKPNCERCAKAKHALTLNKIDFKTLVIGEDIDRGTVVAHFPGVTILPIITRDGVRVLLEEIVPKGPQLLNE